ncbi:hypothetical protein JCM3775_002530 [Rhodotorula graminis]
MLMADTAAATRRSPRQRTARLALDEHDHRPSARTTFSSSPRPASTPTPPPPLARARQGRTQLTKAAHEEQLGAGPAFLPSLLGHLPTTPTFTLDGLTPPSFAYRLPPPDVALSLSPSSSSKRPSSDTSPNPHLSSKKRKVRHAFLRSHLLLAGPAAASSSSSSSSSSSAAESKRPAPAPPRRSSSTARDAPWWPSVSRSHGEGTPSRFAREGAPEACECGSGDGWVAAAAAQLVGRFGALGVSSADAGAEASLRKERRGSGSRSRSRSRGRSRERGGRGGGGGRGGRGRGGAREAAEGQGAPPRALLRPGMPARAASSPAVFGVSGLRTVYEAPVVERREREEREQVTQQQQQQQLEGPALKKALLLNLRARMASDGGTSKGAEAGLRFKKWVVWNAWRARANESQPQVVDAGADSTLDSSSSDDSSSDYSHLGWSDDSSSLLGSAASSLDDNDDDDDELLLGDVDLFLLPDDDGLDALPAPPVEYAPPAEQSDGLVDEPTTVAPLSLLLLLPPPPPLAAADDEHDARGDVASSPSPSPAVVPPVARPPLRRTASLPDPPARGGYPGAAAGAGDEDARAPRGTWEVARGATVVACEG